MSTRIEREEVAEGKFANVIKCDVNEVFLGRFVSMGSDQGSENMTCAGSTCENGCCRRIAFFILSPELGMACKLELDDAVDLAEHILNEVDRLRREA